jgi:phosphoadenosine phosphosulfate reductase
MSQRNEGVLKSAALVVWLTEEARRLDLPDRLVSARREISGRIVFTTSFGIEDQAITHAIFTAGLDIDVVSFDTGRLFPETLEVWGNTERRYGRKIRGLAPDRDGIEKLLERDGVNGFRVRDVVEAVRQKGVKSVPLRLDVAESDGFIAFRDEVIAVLDSEWKASSPSWTTASPKASA